MKRHFAILAAALCALLTGTASKADETPESQQPRLQVREYRGFYHIVDEYGDTIRMTIINDFYVYPPLVFKNKKEEEFYWRTVRDVRKALPYAQMAFNTLVETYEYIQTLPTEKEREDHLKTLEKDIFNKYKPVIKNFTKSQGKVLLKLINRETNQTSFGIVKAFLGTFRAGFWQTFGRFFGMNLRQSWRPDKNRQDAIIDRVATLIEQGSL